MKKVLIILSILFFTNVQAQLTRKVLFIGNSYTAVNNLPSLISSIATANGDILIYDFNTPGGYTFNAHHTNATTLNKIYSDNWDYVVLQEQSQIPSFPPSQVETDCYPYADSLNKFIQENDSCTRTMFYMTWGRKNGDASNCASYPVLCTYDGMQGRLRTSYIEMANDLDAEVSPVGMVWKKFRQDFPSVELYQPDESHPSIHGSYLAACTFYASVFHKSPIGNTFLPVGITSQEALDIQNTVEAIVFDSLQIWRIDTSSVNANFNSFNLSGYHFQFTPDYLNGDYYFWDFGDGNSTTVTNSSSVNHSYSSDGDYTVQLIVSRKCDTDTLVQILTVNSLSVDEWEANPILVYPNPANDYLLLNLKSKGEIKIYNALGYEVYALINGSNDLIIPLEKYPAGNYFLKFNSEIHSQIIPFLIIR